MIESIVKAVQELNEDKVINLAKYRLGNGEEPTEIINSIKIGMSEIGELFESKKFFLTDLIMAGIIFKEVLTLEEMKISINNKVKYNKKPIILIGTIIGDLHDIGKEIFSGMATASGYDIVDIGIDISPEKFLSNYYKYNPDIIGISCVLTDAINKVKAVVDLFIQNELREDVKIIIGGSAINNKSFDYIGADAYSEDVKQDIEICNKWMKKRGYVIE